MLTHLERELLRRSKRPAGIGEFCHFAEGAAVDITRLRAAIADNLIPFSVIEIEPTTEGVTIDAAYVETLTEDALGEPGIILAGLLSARLMDGRHRAAKAIKLGRKTMRVCVVSAPAYVPFLVPDDGSEACVNLPHPVYPFSPMS